MLSICGKPYDTLDEVIGITENASSLKSYNVNYEDICKIDYNYVNNDKEVILGCRPEHIIIKEDGLNCKVNFIEQLGTESILYGDIFMKIIQLSLFVENRPGALKDICKAHPKYLRKAYHLFLHHQQYFQM